VILHVPAVLAPAEVVEFRRRLAQADWVDGRITAGHQSALAKYNLQLPQSDSVAKELGAAVLTALDRHSFFFAAALPRHIFPPLFNRYSVGHGFRNHIDNAIRYDTSVQPPRPVRTDLSVTLFLSSPEDYDGGELVIESSWGLHKVKLPAGDLVLYPATSVHRVETVTRGERLASFFWLQSMIRDAGERQILLELDQAIRKLSQDRPDHPATIELTGVYHNLLKRWAQV